MSYATRFTMPGLPDGQCWARPCAHPSEDKGTLTPGRGYTSYHTTPLPVCGRNSLHGCPDVVPEPDPENARCCFRPDYCRRGSAPVRWRECSICGAHAPRRIADALNRLPTRPGVACRHEGESAPTIVWHECRECRGIWTNPPAPFEPSQHTFDEMIAESERRVRAHQEKT